MMSSTKLWYFSDMHLDDVLHIQDRAFENAVLLTGLDVKASSGSLTVPKINFDPGTEADICVIAGDFCPNLTRSVERLARIAKRMPVVYVPGNRDFYNNAFSATFTMEDHLAKAKARAAEIGNIYVLQDETVRLGDITFIGSTLWSDLSGLSDPGLIARMADFRNIRWGANRAFTPEEYTRRFRKAKSFIEHSLKAAQGEQTVVVTHTLPHEVCQSPRYQNAFGIFYNNDFSDLLVSDIAPSVWICANAMDGCNQIVGRTRLLSNPCGHVIGRAEPENPNFRPDMVFELGYAPALEL